jgi:hypothetical protein
MVESILPPYMRRLKSIETLLPILYLKGISTGDFSDSAAFAGQRIINLARAIHLVRGADVADDAVFGKVGEMVVVAPTRKRIKYDLEKNAGAADGA